MRKIIDRVPLDMLPTSRPCWIPDRPGSIIFAAGDGQLYRHDFEEPGDPEINSGSVSARNSSGLLLRPLVWQSPRPAKKSYYLIDPSWPFNSKLRHFLLATLMLPPHDLDGKRDGGTKLWWMRPWVSTA